MTTDFTDTEREIICGAKEDVEWLPQTMLTHRAFNPELGQSDLLASASATVRSLIDGGYVFLCREKWETPPLDRAMKPVDENEIGLALATPETWVWDDSREEFYCLVATPKGEEAFFELISKPH